MYNKSRSNENHFCAAVCQTVQAVVTEQQTRKNKKMIIVDKSTLFWISVRRFAKHTKRKHNYVGTIFH